MKVGLRFAAESRPPITAQAATSTAVQARLARETQLLIGMTDFSTVVGAFSLAARDYSGAFGEWNVWQAGTVRLSFDPVMSRAVQPSSSARILRGGNDAALDLAG